MLCECGDPQRAWIGYCGATPAAANALSWRPKPAPSRLVADNELIDLYRETAEAMLSNRSLRCRNCSETMTVCGHKCTAR